MLLAAYASGLAEWAVAGGSGGRASAVVEIGSLIASLQNAQHASDGALIGANELSVTLVGASAGLEEFV